ncbi:MAG TPA: nuclear transport factor 2 family protein [Gemmatimonadaceae bacterium]|nr:nuclear transport factor 2 family protein [Gemmatimonadaceae bacterium]
MATRRDRSYVARHMRFLMVAAAVLMLAGFQGHEGAETCARSDAGIAQLHRDWSAALMRADVDSLVKLLDPEFVVVPTVGLPVSREKDLQVVLWSTLGRERVHSAFFCEGRWTQGDLTVERGWDVETLKPHDGTARHTSSQRVMQTLRRGRDGRWRFAWRTLQTAR